LSESSFISGFRYFIAEKFWGIIFVCKLLGQSERHQDHGWVIVLQRAFRHFGWLCYFQLNLHGLTPLQVAAAEDNFPAARCLLQLGVDPDAHAKVTTLQKCCLVNEDAHPHFALEPLFHALTHRNMDLMRLLLGCYHATPFRSQFYQALFLFWLVTW
jgi:ankyrin repeat protein